MTRLSTTLLAAVMAVLVSSVASADVAPSRTLTFVDGRSGLSLTIDTAPSSPRLGQFVLRVPGLGQYVGQSGSGTRVLSETAVVVNFTGEAVLQPLVGADGTFLGSVDVSEDVRVTLSAQIDPAHVSAEATLREGPRRYHLVVRDPGRGELERTLRAVEDAFTANDPLLLFEHVSGDVRDAYTAEAFANSWHAQSAEIGRVVAMRRTALGEPETNESGLAFIVATYDVDRVTPPGLAQTATFDVFFVREGDSWKLLFSRRR